MDSGLLTNFILSLLVKKIVVPSEYHDQVEAVREMLQDDVTGLIDSLTDFAVDTATVDYSIETNNKQFTKILRKWLEEINKDYAGKIPSGIRPLAKEYFKERWKYSSFPVLKIVKWGEVGGILVPTKMFFLDGESIHAKDIDESDENVKLINYDYYLGATEEDNKLGKNIIFSKPFGRWFDKYPIPYLIKRGIYHNYKIIQSLKNKQTTILDQVIPYLMLIKKGIPGTATQEGKIYTQPELTEVINNLNTFMKNLKAGETPTRATNFDEEIKHLIPDLKTIFDPVLFAQAERNILSGLGFIDVVEATSTSRRESILNPKVFIEEVRSGVDDFKQLLKELVILIKDKNDEHKKYINAEFYICSSPIKGFITDDFRNQMRLLWERGQLSNQTYAEIVGEVEYRTEVARREKEAKEGLDYTMYPHVKDNREGMGIDIPGQEPIDKDTDKDGKPIPTDKLDDKDKYNIGKSQAFAKCSKCKNIFDMLTENEAGMGWVKCPKCEGAVTQEHLIKSKVHLEGAPYPTIKSLPDSVKKKLSPAKQRAWLKIFNKAYKFYMKKFGDAKKAESLAFRTAWSQIRQVKSKRKLTQAMLENIFAKEEANTIKNTIDATKLDVATKQSKLLDKLLKDKKKK